MSDASNFPAQGSCGLPRFSRWLVFSVTCRGRCLVLCIVVPQLSLFSFLVTSLDLSVDLLLLLQYFGFWTSHFALQPFHLVHHWSWVEPGPSEPDRVCLAICMSDLPSQAIQELTSAVQALTLAISGQSPSAQPSSADSSPGDWEVIGTETQDIRVAKDIHCTSVKHRTAEEGPGEIPPILLDFARNKLTAKSPGPEFRARRAFNAGFWARIAIDTDTAYSLAEPIPECRIQHWIVLACLAFGGSARFTTRSDFGRAIEGDPRFSVYEAFASQTELEIFCAGASVPLPALRTWRKPVSSLSARGTQASSSGAHPQMQWEQGGLPPALQSLWCPGEGGCWSWFPMSSWTLICFWMHCRVKRKEWLDLQRILLRAW